MNSRIIAPCGLNCAICSGYQRTKNKCVGCKNEGNKPKYCITCRIKTCPEKNGNDKKLCYKCKKYPCKRLKDLEKRYSSKYGESLYENFDFIKSIGMRLFIKHEQHKWKCPKCGKYLCVHKRNCLYCNTENRYFPKVFKG